MFRFKKLHIHKSLDTLRILDFWNIVKHQNPFLIDIDYREGKKYSVEEQQLISDEWKRLYDEYFMLRDDGKSKSELTKGLKGLVVKANMINISHAIKAMLMLKNISGLLRKEDLYAKRQSVYDIVNGSSKKNTFNPFNSIDQDLQYFTRMYNSLKNTYNNRYKSMDTVVKDQVSNVYDVVANAESWLERNLSINDMVVSHWLALEKQIVQKQKFQKNGG